MKSIVFLSWVAIAVLASRTSVGSQGGLDPKDEQGISCVSGNGEVTYAGPMSGTSTTLSIAFTLAQDGKYHILETMGPTTTEYWKDDQAQYEQTVKGTAIFHAVEGEGNSVFFRNMLFPYATVIDPLLSGTEASSKLVSEESDIESGNSTRVYLIESSDGKQHKLRLELGEDELLTRICLIDTSTSKATKYEYFDYIDVGEGRNLPKRFRFSLGRCSSDQSNPLIEILLDDIRVLKEEYEFTPDLSTSREVTDYRKGFPWFKSKAREYLEHLVDR